MLHAGGMDVIVLGFRRRDAPVTEIDGATVVDLGQTGDAKLWQRAWAVLRVIANRRKVRAAIGNADAIMARNLEMLIIGANVAHGRRLTYECLDIHRMLVSPNMIARSIQRLEKSLMERVSLIVTSSPRYADDYFRKLRGYGTPILLLENKVLSIDGVAIASGPPPIAAGPPWVIGWFGMLRCQRSFSILSALVRNSGGRIRVLIAGIASPHEFPDFDADVQAVDGIDFHGRYAAEDLPGLYASVHFAWAIDYFEEGLNSKWLLPNRLYEALAHGAVPIALNDVETGQWLQRHHVGLLVSDPLTEIAGICESMDTQSLERLRAPIADLSWKTLHADRGECRDLVAAIYPPA